jgi:hypothetical protein
MLVKVDLSKLKGSSYSQHAIRFALGGSITAIAGILDKRFGPGISGLFLAFPAIFPASVTLIEKAERSRKLEKGMSGDKRACAAAVLDANGAALGSLALMAFAGVVWSSVARYRAWVVLLGAATVWIGGSVAAWAISRRLRHKKRPLKKQNSNEHVPRIGQI